MKPRPIRFRAEFRADLHRQIGWLRRHRPVDWILALREGLAEVRVLLSRSPAIGEEIGKRGKLSFRSFPLRKLPYVIYYYCDLAVPSAPVWLAMFLHQDQDRERFNPDQF